MKSLKEILEARGVRGSRSTQGTTGASDPKKAIKEWLREHNVRKCTINDDLTIDVNGDVDLTQFNFANFPDYIQFGVVKGFFWTPHEAYSFFLLSFSMSISQSFPQLPSGFE